MEYHNNYYGTPLLDRTIIIIVTLPTLSSFAKYLMLCRPQGLKSMQVVHAHPTLPCIHLRGHRNLSMHMRKHVIIVHLSYRLDTDYSDQDITEQRVAPQIPVGLELCILLTASIQSYTRRVQTCGDITTIVLQPINRMQAKDYGRTSTETLSTNQPEVLLFLSL